jgi:hypothetical protein
MHDERGRCAMNFAVSISVLPDRRQGFEVEAASSMAALREVLGREMVVEALEQKGAAGLVISVLKKKKEVGL